MEDQKQILIVEDTEENVVFLSEILEAHGYGFRVARNGADALVAVKESRPDAVLLDIMMPRKTGISVLQDMKRDPDLQAIPIIVVTGASEATGVDLVSGDTQPVSTYGEEVGRDIGKFLHEKFRDLKPDGFLEKPIDPGALTQELVRVLA